jgi:hypothetical protein
MIIEQLYDALLLAGVPENKAREAARAVTDNLVTKDYLDARLAELETRITIRLGGIMVGGMSVLAALIVLF